MALWSRTRQLKLKLYLFQNKFNRCYSLNHGPIITADQHISSSRRSLLPEVLYHPTNLGQTSSCQLELFNQVRFFASKTKNNKKGRGKPAKSNQKKKEEKVVIEPKLNEEITSPFIRLVSDEGHTVVSRYEALGRAKSLMLDLVEVDKDAKPPVCKIFDYKKEKFLRQVKEKERAKSKSTLKEGYKEVRVAAKISQNDLNMKADLVKRQMESGYRVKCTAVGATNNLDLEILLSRFTELIKDVAVMESAPKVEKTQAFVYVRHVKFGPSKKGPGKKASEAAESSEDEETGPVKPEESMDEDIQPEKSEWAVFNGDEDNERVFNINNDVEEDMLPGGSKSSYTSSDKNPTHGAESAQPVMTNRYARDSRAGIPSRDMNGRAARNTNNIHRIPNQTGPPQQDSSHPSILNTPPKSYGMFSGRKIDPTLSEQNGAVEANNRYKKKDPSHSANSSSTRGVAPQINPSISNREVQRR